MTITLAIVALGIIIAGVITVWNAFEDLCSYPDDDQEDER